MNAFLHARRAVVAAFVWCLFGGLALTLVVDERAIDRDTGRATATVQSSAWSGRGGVLYGHHETTVAFDAHLPVRAVIDGYGWRGRPAAGQRVEVEYERADPWNARRAGDRGALWMAAFLGLCWLAYSAYWVRRAALAVRRDRLAL